MGKSEKKVHGVYLLYSLNETCLGKTYIGYTVDKKRRLLQHNKGTDFGGAKKTNGKGPWEMILIVLGFPNGFSALSFEWNWQNPLKSRKIKEIARKKRNEKSFEYNLRVLQILVARPPFNYLPLEIRLLEPSYFENKLPLYIPSHMKTIENNTESDSASASDSDEEDDSSPGFCRICYKAYEYDSVHANCYFCRKFSTHITCLAKKFTADSPSIIPVTGTCPRCSQTIVWGKMVMEYDLHFSEDDD